jgi:hypothetical protein
MIDVYGNIVATGTANITSVNTNNLTINNYVNDITNYTGSNITINANRGRFGYSGWTGTTSLIVNNNKVNSDSSVFTSISNYYTSTSFPTILASIPSSGNFKMIFSNGIYGDRFDIDFFVVN